MEVTVDVACFVVVIGMCWRDLPRLARVALAFCVLIVILPVSVYNTVAPVIDVLWIMVWVPHSAVVRVGVHVVTFVFHELAVVVQYLECASNAPLCATQEFTNIPFSSSPQYSCTAAELAHVPCECAALFRNIPACPGMVHVPFVHLLAQVAYTAAMTMGLALTVIPYLWWAVASLSQIVAVAFALGVLWDLHQVPAAVPPHDDEDGVLL